MFETAYRAEDAWGEQTAREKDEEARRTASTGRGLPPRNMGGMERPGSRRGQGRDAPGLDGWTAPRPQRAGDLSGLGKIRSSSNSPALLPGFANRQGKSVVKEEAPAEARPANPFALLAGGDEAGASALSPPPSEEAPRRTPLKLQARTVETSNNGVASTDAKTVAQNSEEAEEGEVEDEDEEDGGEMDEAVKRSIDNSIKEFLNIKNVEEGLATFEALPSRHRSELAKAFVIKVVDGKASDVDAVVKLFDAVSAASLIPQDLFRDAFIPTVTDLEDIATDAPKAYNNVGNLMSAADLSDEDLGILQQSMVSNEDDLISIRKRLSEAYKAASSVSKLV